MRRIIRAPADVRVVGPWNVARTTDGLVILMLYPMSGTLAAACGLVMPEERGRRLAEALAVVSEPGGAASMAYRYGPA